MRYTPSGNVRDSVVAAELLQISRAIESLNARIYPKLYAAPDKPQDGMVVFADGTTWNPGSGEGLYRYDESTTTWVSLEAGGGGGGADANAIHVNASAEISGITEKVSPVGADLLVIEDSASANAKRRVQITNLPAAAEVNNLTAAVTWANVPDANITQSSVTQHQAALSITESQISDFGSYLSNVVEDLTPEFGGNLFTNFDLRVHGGLVRIADSAALQYRDDWRSSSGIFTSLFTGINTWQINGLTTLAINTATSMTSGQISATGPISATGNVTGANLNIANWDTAYGWGDHSIQGYAVTSADESFDTPLNIRSLGNTDAEVRTLELNHQNGTRRGYLGHGVNPNLFLVNEIDGGDIFLYGNDAGSVSRALFHGDPDGNSAMYAAGTARVEATTAGATVTGNISVTGTVDGRDLQTDGSKLDGIEAGATADQTDAEIRTAVGAATDSNVFTDSDLSKLNGIASGAEVNPAVVPQAEAEAGTATTERIWTAQRVAQAIAALETGGSFTSYPGAFRDTGSTNISTVTATINLNSEILDPDANYSLASGVITVTTGGYFSIGYSCPINDDSNSGATRSRIYAWVEVDSGAGYSVILQSRAQDYAREASGGEGLATSFVAQLADGDLIRLRIVASGTTDVSTESGESQLSIHRVRAT